jgi:hypothetical protein
MPIFFLNNIQSIPSQEVLARGCTSFTLPEVSFELWGLVYVPTHWVVRVCVCVQTIQLVLSDQDVDSRFTCSNDY